MYSNIKFITYNFLFFIQALYQIFDHNSFTFYQNQEYYITILYSKHLIINSFDFVKKNVESCQSSLHFTQRYFKQIIEKSFCKLRFINLVFCGLSFTIYFYLILLSTFYTCAVDLSSWK